MAKEIKPSVVLLLFAVLGVTLLSGRPAFSDTGVMLDKVEINFRPDKRPIDVINVTNGGTEPFKVKAEITEVKNPGLATYSESPTDKLVAAPKAFELAPGETRSVRLVLRKQPEDMEEFYRIKFVPSRPKLQEEPVAKEGETGVSIRITMSMGAIAFAAPKNPRPEFQFKREGDIIHFTNTGNVTARLQREEYCTDNRDKKTCIQYSGKSIFPGAKWDAPVPEMFKGRSFEQTLLINGKYSKLTYPAN